jgi:hypothetical protein
MRKPGFLAKKTRLAPGRTHTMMSGLRALHRASDNFGDQRVKPPSRMIVSACPPSILAFKLMCGRATNLVASESSDPQWAFA